MITKQAIISAANILKLFPTTIEKDYVLTWVLYGISKQPELSQWFFKGGTCLKKCYFETYRFSEDCDFTVSDRAIYEKATIEKALKNVADIVYEEVGINLVAREIEVVESINKNRHKTYIAKLTYLGPLNLPSRSQQRIKFDITDDETITDLASIKEVFNAYSDAPKQPIKLRCYSANGYFGGENTRNVREAGEGKRYL